MVYEFHLIARRIGKVHNTSRKRQKFAAQMNLDSPGRSDVHIESHTITFHEELDHSAA
jgi:hypothetical protein